MLPKIEALLEGGQLLYTKKATSQGLFFIQIRDGYQTRENLVTRVPVSFYESIVYLKTIHWPLKGDRFFKAITSNVFTLYPNLLYTIGLLSKSNEGSARLPRDSERLQLNVFNQLLSSQPMGLLGQNAN